MQELAHVVTHPGPAAKPQPIAFHGGLLYVGCWSNSHVYAIDPATWTIRGETKLPGIPYGLATLGEAMFVVVSIGEEDDRYLYEFVPGRELDERTRVACPDLTGSHLTSDGTNLFLVQQSLRRVLELDAQGGVVRTVPLPQRCGGLAYHEGSWYFIAADAEFDVVEFATLDLATPGATAHVLAPMHVDARGLAHDGTQWWTSYRELDQIVSFPMPGAAG